MLTITSFIVCWQVQRWSHDMHTFDNGNYSTRKSPVKFMS